MHATVHLSTDFADVGGGVVLLLLGGKANALIEDDLLLLARPFALLRLGYRGDEVRATTGFGDLLCRLTFGVQLPMPLRAFIWRVEDRMIEERVRHSLRHRTVPMKRLTVSEGVIRHGHRTLYRLPCARETTHSPAGELLDILIAADVRRPPLVSS